MHPLKTYTSKAMDISYLATCSANFMHADVKDHLFMESHCGQNSNFCNYIINIYIGISICMQFLSAVTACSQFECNYFMHL